MKTKFLFVATLFLVQIALAQWEPDVRLTDDPSASNTGYSAGAHAIASSGDSIHVVWSDSRNGNSEIFYKRSVDGGTSWGDDFQLTEGAIGAMSPSIVISGISVHVAWVDFRNGSTNYEVYYKCSNDGGNNWTPDTRLSNTPGYSYHPGLAAYGSILHLIYYDYRDNWWEICYRRSADGGFNWEPEIWLTLDPNGSFAPSVCASGQLIHVTWHDNRDGNNEIYYKRSIDNGINWEPEIRLTNNESSSWKSCVGVSGSEVYVVWSDNRNGNYEVFFKRSTDDGLSWGTDTRLTDNSGESTFPNLAISGSCLFVVWRDDSDGNQEIYYKNSIDGGLNWGPDIRLTDDPAESNMAYISASGSQVNLVWADARDGNNEIYYKRDPSGNLNVGLDEDLVGISGRLFHIFPNPASEKIHVSFNTSANKEAFLIIRNILGEELSCSRIQTGEADIDVSYLPNGIYYTTIVCDKTILGQGKLVISK